MLKNKKTRVIVASIAVMLIVGITAFAKQATETISVMYDNIKILIDGVEYTAKDANGNVIEPFIYNGTTYLPVRGIANAFDKDVDWEPQTSTVVLGSKNYDWLDQMGYVDFKSSKDIESGEGSKFLTWEPGKKDTSGQVFDRGLLYYLDYTFKLGDVDVWQETSYLLNSNYKNFKAKLCAAQMGSWEGNAEQGIVEIYLDGTSVFRSAPITNKINPIDVDIDVSDCKIMKIKVYTVNAIGGHVTDRYSAIGIVNARLEKK